MARPRNLDKILIKEVLRQSYDELGSLKAVARKFEVDSGSIKRYMQQYGLKFKAQVIYYCDHDFFSIDNELSLYVAGFIAADGCIKNRKNLSGSTRHELGIGLSKKDKNFLILLKDVLKAETPIRDFIVKNSKRNPKWNDSWKSEIIITSKKICNDLKRFNIIPRKSLIYTFPKWLITHPLCHHFIRGYNDGDGSFYIPKNRKYRTSQQVYFSMRGTTEFLMDVRYVLEQKCGIDKLDKSIRISSGQGCLEYGGNIVVSKITDYLYKDATIYLSRKYDIAKQSKIV